MTKPKKNTYSQMEGTLYFSVPFSYTREEKAAISSYFPKKHQKKALIKTSKYVSELLSCLRSTSTPQNINRKNHVDTITVLYSHVKHAENLLADLIAKGSIDKIKVQKSFRRIAEQKYHNSSLETAHDYMFYTRWACEEALKTYSKPGLKNPHHYYAIQNLAEVWKEYTGKEPTRHYFVTYSKTGGPFINFLYSAIQNPINRLNEEIERYNVQLKKKTHLKQKKLRKMIPSVSLANIAKNVIRHRISMAKKSQKQA